MLGTSAAALRRAFPRMGQITAEMIEKGRGGASASSARQRRNQQHMRDARERLTSAGTGQRAFDLELLRLFARNQRAVVFIQLGLVSAWAAVLPFWLSPWLLVPWTSSPSRRSGPPSRPCSATCRCRARTPRSP